MSSAAMDKFSRVVFRSKSADSEMAFLNARLNKEFKSIPQESGACVWETYVKQIDKLFASVDQHFSPVNDADVRNITEQTNVMKISSVAGQQRDCILEAMDTLASLPSDFTNIITSTPVLNEDIK
jgi:hypothetical protein